MAKYYNLITVGTPANLTATLQSGGNLAANTTYYYRVIAVRVLNLASGVDAHIYGVPTVEVSATTDSTNRTISLSWNAVTNAYGYYVQRTTVSGSYSVGSGNMLAVSGNAVILTATSLVDDGLSFAGGNLDFTEPSPLTEVYSDNNDTIEQYEILAYALSQGWTHVKCPFPQGIVTSPNNTTTRLALPLFFNGGLYLHDCKFRWRGPIGCVNGIFYSAPTVEFVSTQYDYNDAPVLLIYNNGFTRTSTDGRTQSSTIFAYSKMDGTGRLGLHTQYSLMRGGGYYLAFYALGIGNIAIDGGIVYHRVANFVTHDYNNLNNVIASPIRPAHNVSNVDISHAHVSANNSANYNMLYMSDNTWSMLGNYYNNFIINPVFKVVPYKSIYYNPSRINYVTVTIGYTTEIYIADTSGAPISGAHINILDNRGLPATFVLTNAYCGTSFNDSDTYTTVTVINASELSVNDVVRVMGSDEHMLVTNISGSNVTFKRGHNSTPKRKYTWSEYPKFEKLIDLYTDSNGRASVILHSWLLVTKNTSSSYITDTLNNLIANGYMDRYYMTPYTIQAEKSGYTTYTCNIPSLDSPITLDITLLTVGLIPTITEHCHAVR